MISFIYKRVRIEFHPRAQMIGWKVISLESHPDYSVFAGQTNNDWSAIYIQLTPEHALRYLETKYEKYKHIGLCRFEFSDKISFYSYDSDEIRNMKISSKDKANLVKREISKVYKIDEAEPLMKEIGKFECCLVTYDNESSREIVVPHSLLTDDRYITYSIKAEFFRHPESICETSGCKVDDTELVLSKDEKKYTQVLIERILSDSTFE